MYANFANYYDTIFPLRASVVAYLKTLAKNYNPVNLLDIGCATGSLARSLFQDFASISAIDLDASMIEIAKSKNQYPHIEFKRLGMLDIRNNFFDGSFSIISCLGNTLPHLTDLSDIDNFLYQTFGLLAKDGILVISLLNYEKILRERISWLPTFENEEVIFERSYDFFDNLIKFRTHFKDIKTNQSKIDAVNLLPLLKSDLLFLLEKNNFQTTVYSDFEQGKSPDSIEIILQAKKIS